ncbi:Aldehyde/histidinol dehydrogenase [Akanthomyces lecanii RCEF 1005]|uniref:aldehyde dehydrogenase (NAD(+)) n=1 Tax=Akanthomyces lecanii RCEF 1005 TaxID=1081108 RepID=A0A162JYQ3_CORDF|nr:Aldehyde/histidinol dehydrogenase [Akanthomyces lecanii RCEF 1005]
MEAYNGRVLSLLRSASDCVHPYIEQVPKPVLQGSAAVIVILLSIVFFRAAQASAASRPRLYTVDPPTPDTSSSTKPAAVNSSHIACYAPATGQFLGNVPAASTTDIDAAIAAAAAAQRAWGTTTFAQRKAVLRTMLQHVLDNAEQICRVAGLDSGKTLVDAQLGEIMVTAERLQWTLLHGEQALRPERRPTNLLMMYKRNTVRYEPMGVVAALVSWNYPFHNMLGPVISGLFAGNGVVVKVSEQTAWSSAYFADIARGALAAHGFETDLVQTFACWPKQAEFLTSHTGISHITFIGSQSVAHHVAASAAKTLTPVVAELGGKDPFVILDSAEKDLPRIAEVVLRGTFQAAGQNCIGIERVIASGRVYDKLVAMLEPRVKAMRLGPDADMGAMISSASFDRLECLVQAAVAQGARLLAGGKRYAHPDYPDATYFEPTMLADVTPDMGIARQECFAPVLTLMRAEASTADAMLAVANAPNFGLGASVHGSERDPAMEPIVRGLKAGMVAVNDFAVYYAVQLPFGGVRGSGYGRFAGQEGLRGLCNIKSVCEDRFGWLGIRTGIPPPMQYPVPNQKNSWRFAHGVVELGYGAGPRKVKGLMGILKNM